MTKKEVLTLKKELVYLRGKMEEYEGMLLDSGAMEDADKAAVLDIYNTLMGAEAVVEAGGDKGVSDDDIDCVESAFLGGIQNWCNTIRHAIDGFEKEIASGEQSHKDSSFSFFLFRQIIGKLVGKYKIITHIGIKLFEEVLLYLENKKTKDDTISLAEIAGAWDDKINKFQKNISAHQKMYQLFILDRPNANEEDLLTEIAFWPKGGINGLPTDDDIQRSMLELWLRSLEDDLLDTNSAIDLQAGFIYLEIEYHINKSTGKVSSAPIFRHSEIDDLYNEKALKLFKELWKKTPILKTPLDIEIYVSFEKEYDFDFYIRGGRTNGQWKILKHNFQKKVSAKEYFAKVIQNVNLWSFITVDILTTDK